MPPAFQLKADTQDGATNGSPQTAQLPENRSDASQTASDSTWDSHTNRRIAGIYPDVQAHAFDFATKAHKPFTEE